MTTERETLRIIGSWMEDGRTRLPDHVLDAVLDQLPSTPQRRPAWSARRITHVNPLAKYAMVAAAVVVVAVAGLGLYSNQPGGVGGQPSPSPTASPTSLPSPTATPRSAPENGVLAPGTYVFHPLAPRNDSLAVTFTVAEGWQTFGTVLMPSGDPETGPPGGMAILFPGDVTTLNGDPCDWSGADDDVSVGPAVGDLVEALLAQTAYEVSDPVDVAIGGYTGKRVDIVVPTEPFAGQTSDAPECDEGVFQLWTASWGEGGIYAQGPADRWHTNIVDVDGTRLVIVTRDFAGTSPADRAEMDAIIESIVIEP